MILSYTMEIAAHKQIKILWHLPEIIFIYE